MIEDTPSTCNSVIVIVLIIANIQPSAYVMALIWYYVNFVFFFSKIHFFIPRIASLSWKNVMFQNACRHKNEKWNAPRLNGFGHEKLAGKLQEMEAVTS